VKNGWLVVIIMHLSICFFYVSNTTAHIERFLYGKEICECDTTVSSAL